MEAAKSTLLPLLEQTRQYIVPLFQRTYSWEKPQWQRLWDDIEDLLDDDSPKHHFLGSIVTIPSIMAPDGLTRLTLIDGQQRITTILLLLSALRDASAASRPDISREIQQRLLINCYKRGLDQHKLIPTQVDRKSFFDIVTDNAPTRANDDLAPIANKIVLAYRFFLAKLQSDTGKLEKCLRLIENRLLFVSIHLDNDDDPYLVFESLNYKGLSLSQGDLVRNYLFMKVDVKEQDRVYQDYWLPTQVALDKDFEDFVRDLLIARGRQVRRNEIYLAAKSEIDSRQPVEFAKLLLEQGKIYKTFLSPEKESQPRISYLLFTIQALNWTVVYPFFLRCFDDYNNERIGVGALVAIIERVVNFLVRRAICDVPTNQLTKIFLQLHRSIWNDAANETDVLANLTRILETRGYPSDKKVCNDLLTRRFSNTGAGLPLTRLLLSSIEMSYDYKERTSLDGATIEHVLPQKLSREWEVDFFVKNNANQAEHLAWVGLIGNLTLTKYNSEMSNSPFQKKKQWLDQSGFALNRWFRDCDEWSPAAINKRTEVLAKKVVTIWPFFGNSANIIPDAPIPVPVNPPSRINPHPPAPPPNPLYPESFDFGQGAKVAVGQRIYFFLTSSPRRYDQPDGEALVSREGLIVDGMPIQPSRKSVIAPAMYLFQDRLNHRNAQGERPSLNAYEHWFIKTADGWKCLDDLKDPGQRRTKQSYPSY